MRKTTLIFQIGLICILQTLFSPLSRAEDRSYTIGALYGIGAYNNNGQTNVTFGVSFRKLLLQSIGIGATITSTPLSNLIYDNTSTVKDIHLLHLNVDVVYHLKGILPGVWGGVRSGLGIYNANANSGTIVVDYSSTGFDWGPAVGYDHLLAPQYGVGIDLSYISSTLKTLVGNDIRGFIALGTFKFLL